MSPTQRYAKKQAKASKRRRRTAQERLARDRRQAQQAAKALQQALDDLGLPEDLVTEIEGRLRSQHKLLGKIVGMMCPTLFGCRTNTELCRVRGWDKNLPSHLLGALPKRSWLKRLRRLGVEVLVPLWRHAASASEATRSRWQWTWVGDDAVFKKYGEQLGLVGTWWSGQEHRVLWHLGYTEEASAAAFTLSYQEFQRAAFQHEPTYRVRGILTDGFDSTTRSMRTLFPGARLGFCLRHALLKLPKKLAAIASPVRQSLRTQFHTLLYRVRQRKNLRMFALGQRLRHFADHIATTAGMANGERVRRWFQDKKAGWYAVLEDPQMPVTSTLLDQAHNTIERKLFAMKGFHHPGGSQQAFLTGLAHLYNLVPYQRRAQHAGQCGVEVEGGRVPTSNWFLNLQILTSGGFR